MKLKTAMGLAEAKKKKIQKEDDEDEIMDNNPASFSLLRALELLFRGDGRYNKKDVKKESKSKKKKSIKESLNEVAANPFENDRVFKDASLHLDGMTDDKVLAFIAHLYCESNLNYGDADNLQKMMTAIKMAQRYYDQDEKQKLGLTTLAQSQQLSKPKL